MVAPLARTGRTTGFATSRLMKFAATNEPENIPSTSPPWKSFAASG